MQTSTRSMTHVATPLLASEEHCHTTTASLLQLEPPQTVGLLQPPLHCLMVIQWLHLLFGFGQGCAESGIL